MYILIRHELMPLTSKITVKIGVCQSLFHRAMSIKILLFFIKLNNILKKVFRLNSDVFMIAVILTSFFLQSH